MTSSRKNSKAAVLRLTILTLAAWPSVASRINHSASTSISSSYSADSVLSLDLPPGPDDYRMPQAKSGPRQTPKCNCVEGDCLQCIITQNTQRTRQNDAQFMARYYFDENTRSPCDTRKINQLLQKYGPTGSQANGKKQWDNIFRDVGRIMKRLKEQTESMSIGLKFQSTAKRTKNRKMSSAQAMEATNEFARSRVNAFSPAQGPQNEHTWHGSPSQQSSNRNHRRSHSTEGRTVHRSPRSSHSSDDTSYGSASEVENGERMEFDHSDTRVGDIGINKLGTNSNDSDPSSDVSLE